MGAELAELKLALRSARRPSEITGVSTCQAEAILGQKDLLLTEERKEGISLTLLSRPLSYQGTPLLPLSVQYLIHHAYVSPQQFRPACHQEQVPNQSVDFSQQAPGYVAAKATVVGLRNSK